ncbi:MAG: biotin carboxylase [Acidobacteria bacterium]|nr:biotin carboxylase [Acidobacteriota bacterium]
MGDRLIRRLMVPNRGEISVRIARSCREMGITSILACAEDDRTTAFARAFDEIVSLGEGDARDTYLDVEKIVEAARASRADAIHPGYGFLSERKALAVACEAAGVIFIGPRPDAIELMGSKSASRALMERLGVPVVPGYSGEDHSDATLVRESARIGFPLLVKASAGGGGKGMKIVARPEDLAAAIESGRREALKAFGDDRLLIERYIERPRHVEFQVFGDGEGNVLHLFERDCSLQRRHQKIVEESPAPRFSDELRERMADAAIRAAAGVRYRSAGTVEFILGADGSFYFLEMNTRLQVEHPVTEMVLGVDLVRAQIELANGHSMPWKRDDLSQRGHAIECRIYAEDPDNGFLPQSGKVAHYREPSGAGVRVDSGIEEGSVVSVKYDPLLSKLIVHAETRELAIARLRRALDDFTILGTKTNLPYLRRIVRHEAWIRGEVGTHFVAEHEADLLPRAVDGAAEIASVLIASAGVEPSRRDTRRQALPSVWETVGEFSR